MIEKIYNQKKLYAIIIRGNYRKKKELVFLQKKIYSTSWIYEL